MVGDSAVYYPIYFNETKWVVGEPINRVGALFNIFTSECVLSEVHYYLDGDSAEKAVEEKNTNISKGIIRMKKCKYCGKYWSNTREEIVCCDLSDMSISEKKWWLNWLCESDKFKLIDTKIVKYRWYGYCGCNPHRGDFKK